MDREHANGTGSVRRLVATGAMGAAAWGVGGAAAELTQNQEVPAEHIVQVDAVGRRTEADYAYITATSQQPPESSTTSPAVTDVTPAPSQPAPFEEVREPSFVEKLSKGRRGLKPGATALVFASVIPLGIAIGDLASRRGEMERTTAVSYLLLLGAGAYFVTYPAWRESNMNEIGSLVFIGLPFAVAAWKGHENIRKRLDYLRRGE